MGPFDGRLFINNERRAAGEKAPVENPATLEPLGEVHLASSADCREAVEIARQACARWRNVSRREKRRIFLEAQKILLRRGEEIARLITLEKGSPLLESLAVEILTPLEALDHYGRDQTRTLAPRKIANHIAFFAHKKSRYVFQPLGPTLAISPWNFPFAIPFLDVISELTAGNTVILRPSTSTPFSALAIGEILLEAGLPPGVLNILPCRVPQAEEMILNPHIQSIAFTGSVATGKRIMELASRNLTNVVLELGGKDPMIVLEDADLEQAARGAVWAAFMNAGQSCASIERVYAAGKIVDRFVGRVVDLTRELRVGNPINPGVDVGPMENLGQLRVVEEHVREARDKGAEVLCGGERIRDLPGYFFAPTVLTRVDHHMKIMTEETFGPVLPVMAFADVADAVALANDSPYGLTASVWTRDKRKAARVADLLEVGGVTINDHMITFTEPTGIWGGIKQTSMGRTHGPYGLLEVTNIKFVSADFAGKKDRLWWFPYSARRLKMMAASLTLLHHRRLGAKVKALLSLLPELKSIRSGLPFRSFLKVSARFLRK